MVSPLAPVGASCTAVSASCIAVSGTCTAVGDSCTAVGANGRQLLRRERQWALTPIQLAPLLSSSLVPFPGSSPPARQVGASLAPAGRTGRPRWPARVGKARPAGRARLGPLWSPKWDRWTPNRELVMPF